MRNKRAWTWTTLGVACLGVGVFAGPGCVDDKACLVWDASRGACPASLDAMRLMQPECGQIASVDSEGEFVESEGLCCYSVTNSSYIVTCTPAAPAPPKPDVPSPCGVPWGWSCEGCIATTPCCDILIGCHNTEGCQECIFGQVCPLGSKATVLADEAESCIWKTPCRNQCYTDYYHAAACDAPPPPGQSGGACTAENLNWGIECNIVTQTGCAPKKACLHLANGDATCVDPTEEDDTICSACGASERCPAGYGCLTGFCARYCCDDSDCGTGICKKMMPAGQTAWVRFCVDKYGGELGGMGGAAGAGAGGADGTGGAAGSGVGGSGG